MRYFRCFPASNARHEARAVPRCCRIGPVGVREQKGCDAARGLGPRYFSAVTATGERGCAWRATLGRDRACNAVPADRGRSEALPGGLPSFAAGPQPPCRLAPIARVAGFGLRRGRSGSSRNSRRSPTRQQTDVSRVSPFWPMDSRRSASLCYRNCIGIAGESGDGARAHRYLFVNLAGRQRRRERVASA
jgi:hypothetical protein